MKKKLCNLIISLIVGGTCLIGCGSKESTNIDLNSLSVN